MRAPDTGNVVCLSDYRPRPDHAREPGFIRLEWWVPADWRDDIETALENAINRKEGGR
ncbi:hypothetical protein T8K17_11360 [Thalassobaculum sp. OXR-137]|uniref:hypothetical protein n=1 Tax=Thalassobaculum sp. OXR-137 TaxID=3100173 RepID=UPI002AC95B93|nr:hypothetical protein [Thalassobaculum sp. OXR-137]WPZ36732.1 hypothetical protein T8K17_11360 [Thalassobaculum sp. OXR-137]